MEPFRVPRPPREQAAVDRDRPPSAPGPSGPSSPVPTIFSSAGYPIESRVRGRRPAGKNRKRASQAAGAEADNGVFEPRASIPEPPHTTLNQLIESATRAEAGDATSILQTLGSKFVEARQLNKGEAWRQLQADLMQNAHILCPFVLPYDRLLTSVREIEDFMKGSSGQVGRSNEELMAEFLRGEGPLAAELAATQAPDMELAEPAMVPPDGPDNMDRGSENEPPLQR